MQTFKAADYKATHFLWEVSGKVATITLNRPGRRNALSVAAAERLYDLWEEVDRRDDIRAVVLTAASCGTFCAGMDLKEASELQASRGIDVLTQASEAASAVDAALIFDHIDMTFPDGTRAIDDVSFGVRPGSRIEVSLEDCPLASKLQGRTPPTDAPR